MSLASTLLRSSVVRRYGRLVQADLAGTYARDLHKWLIVAPLIGLSVGLFITALSTVLLDLIWPWVLNLYLTQPYIIIPGIVGGFTLAGLLMQYLTPDPDEHSTEEIIRSYHHRAGQIAMRPFLPKILAALLSVGSGASAALEGPSIYGGGAIGSTLWAQLKRFASLRLTANDRRIMLISGAAAGMAAVFRAPLTGIVFALEMPYKDDLAHQALVPALISSVVAYITMAAFIGAEPLFHFGAGDVTPFTRTDLLASALLGLLAGLAAMAFAITFRRFRRMSVRSRLPHWLKMALGGLLTGLVGLLFLTLFPGDLIPIGLNYEAVTDVLVTPHATTFLLAFAALKLAATLFSLGSGGVSAMFVPLFLCGGALGVAFAQGVLGTSSVGLYAAVGMASFISAGYKAPLTAVVFIAEAAGGHAFIIPALIGSAVAYAASGEASASGDQSLHQGAPALDPVEHSAPPALSVYAPLPPPSGPPLSLRRAAALAASRLRRKQRARRDPSDESSAE